MFYGSGWSQESSTNIVKLGGALPGSRAVMLIFGSTLAGGLAG